MVAAKLVDLVAINILSNGTGALSLGTAVEGYRGKEVLQNGAVYSYAIQQGGNYEYGTGTYLSASSQMLRSPIASSTGGTAINLQPGAYVAFVALAEDIYGPIDVLNPLTGEGAPDISVGQLGQVYFDTAAPALYGPKTTDGWGDPIALTGPTGPTGPANNTRLTLADLKAAATTDNTSLYDDSLWTWTTGDFTGKANDINIVQSDHAAISTGAWVRSATDNAPSLDAVRAIASLDTVFCSTVSGRYTKLSSPLTRREDNSGDYILDRLGNAWSFTGRVGDIRPELPTAGQIIGNAARGATVNIGCIGDSTTDGALTTSFVQNPTSGTDPNWGVIPSATTDHTDEAPNAWPAVLRQILQDHYKSASINVWNGGYGGQSLLATGYWGSHWFTKIFSGNPNYGTTPDLTLIMFGLNDANTGSATMVSDYLQGLRALCGWARGAGSVPVVMLPISTVNPAYTFRQLRELAPAVRHWCELQGVELIDTHEASTKYWAINGRIKMAAEIADFVHPGDNFHGFLAGFIATQLCADIRRVTGAAEGIGAFEVWANPLVQSPVANLSADSRYAGWTNTAGFTNADQIDAFVWIDDTDYIAHLRMFSGSVSGTPTASDLPEIRVTSAESYRESGSTYIDRKLSMGDRGAPFNYLADVPIEIGRLRYGLNRIRVTLPATTKVACQFDCLEFTRSGLPARDYQVRANVFVSDRRYSRGRASLAASSHLELPPESHGVNSTTVVSFGLLGDQVTATVTLSGPTAAGVNLLTAISDAGKRMTFGAVKDADQVRAYVTNTEDGTSTLIGGVAHPSGEPDSVTLQLVYSNGSDLQPQVQLSYAGSVVATYKNVGGFAIPVAGRIGGSYSIESATVTGDVTYSVDMLRTTA